MSIEGEDSSVISRLLRSYFGYGNNLSREERDDNPLSQTLWNYDKASWLLSLEGAQPGNEQWRWDGAGNPMDRHTAAHVMHNHVTELNGIRWQYDIHGPMPSRRMAARPATATIRWGDASVKPASNCHRAGCQARP